MGLGFFFVFILLIFSGLKNEAYRLLYTESVRKCYFLIKFSEQTT